jgi:hypothetical protein
MLPAFLAAQDLAIFITSNTEGRFSIYDDPGGGTDPALLILQSLYREKAGGSPVLFFDLGNAFYPGILSRYSYGSVTYDYLSMNGCDAALVSSKDLRIGTTILQQLNSGRDKILLSSNIRVNKKNIFLPYVIKTVAGKKIAIIGLTNERPVFDITEKSTSDLNIVPHDEVLKEILAELQSVVKPEYIILLSGLKTEKNVEIINAYPSISMIISGGDSKGNVYGKAASQIIYPDGRRILLADSRKGYYKIEARLGESIVVKSFSRHDPEGWNVKDRNYHQFVKRLNIWKKRYNEEMTLPFEKQPDLSLEVQNSHIAYLMRDKMRTEVSIISADTLRPLKVDQSSTMGYIRDSFSDDYYIYRYKLKGRVLKSIIDNPSYHISGIEEGKIQGYNIDKDKTYTVSSTQKIFEEVSESDTLKGYTNTWLTIPELFVTDIQTEKIVAKKDYSYLDNRFVFLCNITLSNKISSETVEYGANIVTPSGFSTQSTKKWGLENSADFILYNRYNRVTFSPYMNYVEEKVGDEKYYLANELSAKLLYQYSLNLYVQPYFKSQCNTVVKQVEVKNEETGLYEKKRPVDIRETAGVLFNTKYTTTKLGAGFDKRVHDDEGYPNYGFEFTASVKYPFWDYFRYFFDLDFFATKGKEHGKFLKTEASTGLSYNFNDYLKLTAKYKLIHYRDLELEEKYVSKAASLSLDLVLDFKYF